MSATRVWDHESRSPFVWDASNWRNWNTCLHTWCVNCYVVSSKYGAIERDKRAGNQVLQAARSLGQIPERPEGLRAGYWRDQELKNSRGGDHGIWWSTERHICMCLFVPDGDQRIQGRLEV